MRGARLLLAGLVLAATPAMAAPPLRETPVAAADSAAGRLVELLVTEDGMRDFAAGLIAYRAAHDPRTGSATRGLNARYPGLANHVAERLGPQLGKVLRRALPSLRDEVRTIVAASMTAHEIADSQAFFGSPAGKKVYANILRAIADKPDRGQDETMQVVMTAAFSNIEVRDYPAVLAFSASSAAGKINAINPRIATASRAWADRLIAKNGAKIDKLSKRATKEFIKKAAKDRNA